EPLRGCVRPRLRDGGVPPVGIGQHEPRLLTLEVEVGRDAQRAPRSRKEPEELRREHRRRHDLAERKITRTAGRRFPIGPEDQPLVGQVKHALKRRPAASARAHMSDGRLGSQHLLARINGDALGLLSWRHRRIVPPAGGRYFGACCPSSRGREGGGSGVDQTRRRVGWVRVTVVALAAIGCDDDDADRRARIEVSRALVQPFTLATAELTGSSDGWTSYVELGPAAHIVCNYNLPAGIAAGTLTSLSLDVNYMGPS